MKIEIRIGIERLQRVLRLRATRLAARADAGRMRAERAGAATRPARRRKENDR